MASLEQQLAVIYGKLREEIQEVMMDEVRKVINNALIDQGGIAYEDYEPKYYRRRQYRLTNPNFLLADLKGQDQVYYSMNIPDKTRKYNVVHFVEHGASYGTKDRTIHRNTVEVLKGTNDHTLAMKQGLVKRGWKVK